MKVLVLAGCKENWKLHTNLHSWHDTAKELKCAVLCPKNNWKFAYWLRAGVRHTNIICDACQKQGVQGMRWKCTRCHDFDLCSLCYMADKHDINHAFYRFDSPSSKG